MNYKKSSFNVSDEIIEYRSESLIDDAVSVLETLKGKTVSEIKDIYLVLIRIAQDNSKLL